MPRAAPMRQMRPQPPARPTPQRSGTVMAPTKGWNARDAIAEMEEGFAVILDNWFPKPANIALRNGFTSWATGLGSGNVDTLAEFAGLSIRKLIACANNKIYDASSSGAATDITAGSAITLNQWQWTNFGKNLFLVNGTDTPKSYDGTTVADLTFTGPTLANLIHVNGYKNRLYFVEKLTMKYWYGGVDAITGALTAVDLATVFRLGGNLQVTFTWPRETFNGPVLLQCFMSTLGEILVYSGSYPGDTAWTLVARYYIAPPVSRRCTTIFGGDVAIITTLGLISMNALAEQNAIEAPTLSKISLSDVINPAFNAAAATNGYGTNFGWDAVAYPQGSYLLINIPVAPGSVAYQYVMNTLTRAWCRFTGMNAQSWSLFNNNLYFGGNNGTVYKADMGTNDNGGSMTIDVLPAYSYFGDKTNLKRFLLARPVFESNGGFTISADLQVDFKPIPAGSPLTAAASGSPWNTSPWNTTPWTQGTQIRQITYGVHGIGRAASLRLRGMVTNLQLALDAISLVWEPGSWLG